MGFGGGPKNSNFGVPPPAAHPPTPGSAYSAIATQAANNAAAAADGKGFDNTIETSPQGLKDKASTAKVTLLGQAAT